MQLTLFKTLRSIWASAKSLFTDLKDIKGPEPVAPSLPTEPTEAQPPTEIKYMTIITLDELQKVYPKATQENLEDLSRTCQRYEITTPRRFQYFMAQAYSETQGFTKFVEDLFYTTPLRIAQVWPSRFWALDAKGMRIGSGTLDAREYVRNPEKLANEVYANRMGNGDRASGDGYKFRGRGAGHLTGQSNYYLCSKALFLDERLIEDPDQVAGEHAFLTFGWFWAERGLNALADRDEFTNVTQRINGASGARLTAVVQERLPNLSKMKRAFPTL